MPGECAPALGRKNEQGEFVRGGRSVVHHRENNVCPRAPACCPVRELYEAGQHDLHEEGAVDADLLRERFVVVAAVHRHDEIERG